MRKVSILWLFTLAAAMTISVLLSQVPLLQAKEVEHKFLVPDDISNRANFVRSPGAVRGIFGVSQAGADTFYYGGTVIGTGDTAYAATPTASGWANRKMWTWSPIGFNGVPHSGLNMDGWTGVDNTSRAVDYFCVVDNDTLGTNCVINGTKSLFCGATRQVGQALCYVDQNGTGYGNNWLVTVVSTPYTYNSGNQIALSYSYKNQSEPGYDFTEVILQIFNGTGWVNHDTMAEYTGNASGSASIDVDSYMGSLTPPVNFRIAYSFYSDGGYSDQDGNYPTSCGALFLDDYVITGDVRDSVDFEDVPVGALPSGWQRIVGGVGNFVRVEDLSGLPVGLSQDPCVSAVPGLCQIADSVIVMYDPATPSYPHPCSQDNMVVSPIIDLADHPGLGGKLFQFERFGSLPMTEYVFYSWQIRFAPGCPAGGWGLWISDNYLYYTPEGTSCSTILFDASAYIPPSASRVQVTLNLVNWCCEWMDLWGGPTVRSRIM